MAVTITKQNSPLANQLVRDSSCYSVKENVTGGTGTLYQVEIDNSSNAAAVYFKLLDGTSATMGTTSPTFMLYCPANKRRSFVMPKGVAFSSGFTHWCTTGAADTSSGEPGTKPDVWYLYESD
tara:strand:- start:246 stop:614 length:369 start_codon:yes stop_codon:yes gene_type:complete